MLRELIKRELAWKAAPLIALFAAIAWPFVFVNLKMSVGLFFCFCFVFLYAGIFKKRATLFEAALPIPGRQLVAARLLARLAMCWLPALAIIGETFLLDGVKPALLFVWMCSLATVGVLVTQSFWIRKRIMPDWLTFVPVAFWMLPFFCLALLNTGHCTAIIHWAHSHGGGLLGSMFAANAALAAALSLGLLFAANAALAAALWLRTPEGFQVAPAKAKSALWAWLRRWLPLRICWPAWWPDWRAVYSYETFIGLLLGTFFALLTLGYLAVGAITALFPMVAARRVEWLAVLPITRRRLLFIMMLPWLCGSLAGVWMMQRVEYAARYPMVSTGYSAFMDGKKTSGSGTPNVLVPTSIWTWALAWKAPIVQAPWGEKTQPQTFHRLGLAFYNPYSVAPGNSKRFLEWQFARATEAVYGRAVPLERAAELEQLKLVPVARRFRTHYIAMLATASFFLVALLVMFWGRTKEGYGWLALSLAGLGIFVLPFCDASTSPHQVEASGSLGEVMTLRLAALLPQNWALLIAITVVLLGGLYLAAEKQFEKVDLIPALRRAEGEE